MLTLFLKAQGYAHHEVADLIQISPTTLRTYLDQTKQLTPNPELHIQPDPYARYARVDEMLSVVKRSEVTKVGFVGNEQFANFGK